MPGWQPLIVCSTDKPFDHPCGFADLAVLVHNLITDLVLLSTIAVIIVAAIIGFKLMTSGGDTKARDAAKSAAWAVIKGYAVILLAWVVVYTILNALVGPGYILLKP